MRCSPKIIVKEEACRLEMCGRHHLLPQNIWQFQNLMIRTSTAVLTMCRLMIVSGNVQIVS